jgi:uncharacterized membrane protein
MGVVRTVALIAATISTGLMAGVFWLYAHTVMPGLRRADDRLFVGAFQALDRAIVNAWFLAGGFLGALVLTAASVFLHFGGDSLAVPAWIVAGFVLYLATVVITFAVNVPLNDALKAAGDPDAIEDLAGVRRQFNEARWVRWNLARTVLTTAAFACLTVALVEYGRSL